MANSARNRLMRSHTNVRYCFPFWQAGGKSLLTQWSLSLKSHAGCNPAFLYCFKPEGGTRPSPAFSGSTSSGQISIATDVSIVRRRDHRLSQTIPRRYPNRLSTRSHRKQIDVCFVLNLPGQRLKIIAAVAINDHDFSNAVFAKR